MVRWMLDSCVEPIDDYGRGKMERTAKERGCVTTISDEIQRLIYQSIMSGEFVIISPNDEQAAEHFKKLREAVVVAADELRVILEKTERDIIQGFAEYEPLGMIAALCKPIEMSRQSIAPLVKQRRFKNNFRKPQYMPMRRIRCRWRQRESRRKLEGLSPSIVIIDELNEVSTSE